MSRGRVSLFTNVTWAPRATVTFLGDTPPLVMVIVAPPVLPPGFGVGEVVLSSPQAVIVNAVAAANMCFGIRMIAMLPVPIPACNRD
jgi:hypothetical protein